MRVASPQMGDICISGIDIRHRCSDTPDDARFLASPPPRTSEHRPETCSMMKRRQGLLGTVDGQHARPDLDRELAPAFGGPHE